MNECDCQHLLGELSDYVDGELGQAMCQEIERHLAGCHNCRIVVDTLRKTVTLYQTSGEDQVPDEVQERLFKVLDLDQLRSQPE